MDIRDTAEWKRARKAMLEAQPYCTVCGGTERLQVDHIIPLSKNGAPFAEENLQVLCGFHNNQKHNKTTEQVNDWINKRWREWSA